ncbi:MAG: TRAP transporter large permease [Butyricicoccus pullicaecorum]|nr:TRAP transporter large permease [Butyricicoccus pullicaecorum]
MIGAIFAGMLVLLVLAVPICVVIAMISLIPYGLDATFAASPMFILRNMVSGLDSITLIAIPMFVLSGIIMARGGISKKLFNVFSYFIGDKTGGLPCAVVITCLFYGAISGSAPATTAAVGAMTIPILVGLGYDLTFCAALVAISGGLGVIIPPSIPFILYSMNSGASVGELFIAGILPGILIGVCLMLYSIYYCKKHGEDKGKLRENIKDLREQGFLKVFMDSFWALLSPVIILGSIYGGICTPTEAAVISVIYALVICLFVYKTLAWNEIYAVLREGVETYAPILFILGAAQAFSRVLTLTQAPQMLAETMGSAFSSKVALILIINVFLLFVGMVMDTGPAILILTPILVPIVKAAGIDPVHFGVIMIVNLAIGFVTPPIGNNLYVASTLTKLPVTSIAKKAMPFMAAFFIALMIITFVPQVSLLLVR